MFKHPFSFNGRIRRSEFGLSFIIYFICYVFISGSLSSRTEGTGIAAIALIPLIWFIWAQGAKRCHVLGKNGFWLLIPFYVLWMLFADGDQQANEYGLNPKDITENSNIQVNEKFSETINNASNSNTTYGDGHINLSKHADQ